jgi:hypothetical protein
MEKTEKSDEGPSSAWDYRSMPDWDDDFYNEDDILAFASALSAPEVSPSEEDLLNPKKQNVEFITALNDWAPVRQTVKGRENSIYGKSNNKRRRKHRRGRDETREGWSYNLTRWPLLMIVLGWLLVESALYGLTRFYIVAYERYIAWRGKRDRLRKSLRKQTTYDGWTEAAKELDTFLGNDVWKVEDEYAYYDDRTIRRVMEQMRRSRNRAEQEEHGRRNGVGGQRPIDQLVELAKSCVKNNFAGSENPRLYSETYYGTKNLVQAYVDEVSASLKFLFSSNQLTQEDKRDLSRHLSTNFGRTALCLSGGASFAWVCSMSNIL